MSLTIDLNADVGESFGDWRLGDDEALMPSLSSANVACGFHAGDPGVIRRTIALAKAHGVAVGAHPGYPDLAGFGRRDMAVPPAAITDLVLYQVAALGGMAAALGARLAHVKPHGALYNRAASDEAAAAAIARAVALVDRHLVLFGLAGSRLLEAGRREGLRVASEAFADRGYESDGRLRARDLPGALVTEPATVVSRVLQMIESRWVTAVDGSTVALDADTICLHGDTPGAADLARRVRQGLEARGVRIAPPGQTRHRHD
jgi:5-oxoprolinase (ATP-hydrolysing) subunit A